MQYLTLSLKSEKHFRCYSRHYFRWDESLTTIKSLFLSLSEYYILVSEIPAFDWKYRSHSNRCLFWITKKIFSPQNKNRWKPYCLKDIYIEWLFSSTIYLILISIVTQNIKPALNSFWDPASNVNKCKFNEKRRELKGIWIELNAV